MVDPTSSKTNAQRTQHQVNQLIVDSNDPAEYAGKHISDDDKFKLLTSKSEIPNNFKFSLTLGRSLIRPSLLVGHGCVTA